jgi:hypothetical protein
MEDSFTAEQIQRAIERNKHHNNVRLPSLSPDGQEVYGEYHVGARSGECGLCGGWTEMLGSCETCNSDRCGLCMPDRVCKSCRR